MDLDSEGNFLGLGIIGAAEKLPLTSEELEEVETVDVEVETEGETIMVSITLETEVEKASINLPLKTGG